MSETLSGFVCPRCHHGLVRAPEGVRCTGCGATYGEEQGILNLRHGGDAQPGYDPHCFETLPLVEGEHFWFVTRREIILDGLRRAVPDLEKRPLYDIGCGSGGLLSYLGDNGIQIGGACDAYREGLRLARSRTPAPLAWVDLGEPPPLAPGRRLVAMFDVLEHIDDDEGTLSWVASILEPGGVLALTVPAHPFLFDEMDELACHRRRYTRPDLRRKLRAAGFEVRILTHFMAPLVPLLIPLRWAGRAFLRSRPAGRRRDTELSIIPGVNPAMRMVLRLERLWLRSWPLPWGSSLLAVASLPLEREPRSQSSGTRESSAPA